MIHTAGRFPSRGPMPLAAALLVVALASPVLAAGQPGEPDALASLLLSLAVILTAAKLGGDVAVRLGQPPVLGELVAGVLIGGADLLGFAGVDAIRHDATLDILASLGAILLLFEVGLESTVGQMMKVGWRSFLVASVGVAAPFLLGWGVGAWMLPQHSPYVHVFLGAALCATSVGITARVLKDLGWSASNEARVILGAAVIDDVMGLVILALVTALVSAADLGGGVSYAVVGVTLLKAIVFLVGSLGIGVYVTPRLFSFASRLRTPGVLLALGLTFCFVLSWLSAAIGLAPIVGAFSAGLILEGLHSRKFVDRGERSLEQLIAPITSFLVPVFFVLMGIRTELRSFLHGDILVLAAALTAAAIAGKQACGLVAGRGMDRLSVGIGMIPRGEVGLIFANIGLGLSVAGERIIEPQTFSALVIMVIVTTLVTPPALKWSLARRRHGRGGSAQAAET